MQESPEQPSAQKASLWKLAGLFLKIGAIAFGGPPAHIAMMDEEVVSRRSWLTREQFLDFLGASNLIPGPTSTEMAIYVGRMQAGWPGLVVAGSCFILPSAVFVAVLAWAYVGYGSLPQLAGVLYGIKPIVIAVIAQAIFKMARSAVKSPWLGGLAVLAIVAFALGVNEIVVLAGGGLLAGIAQGLPRKRASHSPTAVFLAIGSAATAATPFSLGALFGVFLKIGAVLFGGGYVLVALIRSNLVARLGWITERQLLDAIAIGQVTPGPISTAATFIGYLLARFPGAAVATIAMFLPAFFFVVISGPLIPWLRRSPLAGAVLDGVNVAALALITVVAGQLFRAAVVDWPTLLMSAASLWLLLQFRVNSVWLILAGALLGSIRIWPH